MRGFLAEWAAPVAVFALWAACMAGMCWLP